jgi:hypothetical protein
MESRPFNHETLRSAVDASIAESNLLQPVDAGVVRAARTMADAIDTAVQTCEGQELTKALYLMPHLTGLMREMLATPAARAAAKVKPEAGSDKKAKLTALRGGKSA